MEPENLYTKELIIEEWCHCNKYSCCLFHVVHVFYTPLDAKISNLMGVFNDLYLLRILKIYN